MAKISFCFPAVQNQRNHEQV